MKLVVYQGTLIKYEEVCGYIAVRQTFIEYLLWNITIKSSCYIGRLSGCLSKVIV